ncbi:MAG: DUF4143 domain-containing protein [Bacteroidota bacterium]|nr:DUF4143 domain-containing protein [Bacteroidota bacterium]
MEELESFDRKGASWEGFIIQQVIALLLPTITPYFYRTQDGAEVDLLLIKGNQPVLALEIKYSNTPTVQKGTTIALSDLGDIPCLMVTPSVGEDYSIRPNQLVTALARLFKHPALVSYLLP